MSGFSNLLAAWVCVWLCTSSEKDWNLKWKVWHEWCTRRNTLAIYSAPLRTAFSEEGQQEISKAKNHWASTRACRPSERVALWVTGFGTGVGGEELLCWLQGSAKCLHCILGSKVPLVFGLHMLPTKQPGVWSPQGGPDKPRRPLQGPFKGNAEAPDPVCGLNLPQCHSTSASYTAVCDLTKTFLFVWD